MILSSSFTKYSLALSVESASVFAPASTSFIQRMMSIFSRQDPSRDFRAQGLDIFENIPAAMHIMDAQGRIISVNAQWSEMTGMAPSEVVGHNIREYLSASGLAESDVFENIQPGAVLHNLDRRLRTKSHEPIDVLFSARVDSDKHGLVRRVICVLVDVSEHKKAELASKMVEDRARQIQKMDAIGKLTGGIAHDLNNMLTIVNGYLDRALQNRPEEDRVSLLINKALQASFRSDKLIDQLMAFSQQKHLAPRPVRVRHFLESITPILQEACGDNITLNIAMPGAGQWHCIADKAQLEAAVINLVLNARDAISGQGEIRICVANVTVADTILLQGDLERSLNAGEYIQISVTDTGAGMSEEVLNRAMEPFFTTRMQSEGYVSMGLGLPQTYGFVVQSGGSMRIESHIGRGTRVDMLLPRHNGEAQPVVDVAPKASVLPEAGTGPGVVLVVEDESDLREIVAESLQEAGFTVLTAEDGEVGLRLISERADVEMVFTDIVMPGPFNGIGMAFEALRARPGLPIVFASGYSAEALRTQPLPAGCMMISKPYRLNNLVNIVRDHVATGRRYETEKMSNRSFVSL